MAAPPPAPPGSDLPTRLGRRRQHRWLILLGGTLAALCALGVVVWLWLPRLPGRPGGYWFPLGGVFVLFLVIWLAFVAVRMAFWGSRRQRYWEARSGAGYGGPPRFDPAIRTARLRYARGEITREQYDEIVRGLRPGPPLP